MAENVEISDDYALKLHQALRQYFSDLDFVLLIVNPAHTEKPWEERRILPNVIKLRGNGHAIAPITYQWAEYIINDLLLSFEN